MLELLALIVVVAIGYWTYRGLDKSIESDQTKKSEANLDIPVAPILTQQMEPPKEEQPATPKKPRKPRAKKSAE